MEPTVENTQQRSPEVTVVEPVHKSSSSLWVLLGILLVGALIFAIAKGDRQHDMNGEYRGTAPSMQNDTSIQSFNAQDAAKMQSDLEATAIDGLSDSF